MAAAAWKVVYVSDCGAARHHLTFNVLRNGSQVASVEWERADVLAGNVRTINVDPQDALEVLVRDFCFRWRTANPSGTIGQLRTALEAAEFYA